MIQIIQADRYACVLHSIDYHRVNRSPFLDGDLNPGNIYLNYYGELIISKYMEVNLHKWLNFIIIITYETSSTELPPSIKLILGQTKWNLLFHSCLNSHADVNIDIGNFSHCLFPFSQLQKS